MQSTKEQEIPKCACNEKYCGVLTRFLQYVDCLFAKLIQEKCSGTTQSISSRHIWLVYQIIHNEVKFVQEGDNLRVLQRCRVKE